MGRWLVIAAVAGLLGACGTFDGTLPGDPPREVFGVSASQPQAADATTAQPKAVATDQWQTGQICTRGYDRLRQDVEAAGDNMQLVDWQLRCRPYALSIFGVSLPNSLSHPF